MCAKKRIRKEVGCKWQLTKVGELLKNQLLLFPAHHACPLLALVHPRRGQGGHPHPVPQEEHHILRLPRHQRSLHLCHSLKGHSISQNVISFFEL